MEAMEALYSAATLPQGTVTVVPADLSNEGVPVRLIIDGIEVEELFLRQEPDGSYSIDPLPRFEYVLEVAA
jgi:hypothetical protein